MMNKIFRSFFLILSLLFFVHDSSAQSGLSGLAGAIGSPTIPTVVPKKIDEISPPLNIDNASMDDYLLFEKNCRSGDGNSCLYAGKIVMSDRPPQEIFNLSTSTRINRAIRLYEASISASMNLEAMELAYDLYYDKNILTRQLNSYTDKDRAKELMGTMLSKKYPGGLIRQAREYVDDPEYILSLSKKKEACETARSLNNISSITVSTKLIIDEILSGNICAIYSK
jgi:hypothetical protein